MSSRRGGLTLVDLIVATTAGAVVLVVILALLPVNVASQKRAQDMQAATTYGVEVVNATRSRQIPDSPCWETRVHFNGTSFTVKREMFGVPETQGRLSDVMVTVTWPRRTRPVVLTTRIDHRRVSRMSSCPSR